MLTLSNKTKIIYNSILSIFIIDNYYIFNKNAKIEYPNKLEKPRLYQHSKLILCEFRQYIFD